MKPAYLDHIGIAVTPNSNLAKALAVLGLPIEGKESVDREGVDVEWIALPQESGHVELLHPQSPETTIGKFLSKNGKDGIHHLSFRVENILETSDKLQAAGFRLIYPMPKNGANDCLVNFLHPQTTGGVLLEITQKQAN